MAENIEPKVIRFRSRSYALAKMQSSLENESIVEVIEKAIENYVNEDIKKIINAQYGEWEERPKKTGRPKKIRKEDNSYVKEIKEIIEEEIKEENFEQFEQNETITKEDKDLLDLYS
ncbi:MAG: hypothetical protein MJH09_02015 [Cetobacterium sp.]|nr:hypothetical protein [Cetobacterium sp.]